MRTGKHQKWYLSQKKWYFSHFAKTQKEIHTLSPEPDGAHPRGPGDNREYMRELMLKAK